MNEVYLIVDWWCMEEPHGDLSSGTDTCGVFDTYDKAKDKLLTFKYPEAETDEITRIKDLPTYKGHADPETIAHRYILDPNGFVTEHSYSIVRVPMNCFDRFSILNIEED